MSILLNFYLCFNCVLCLSYSFIVVLFSCTRKMFHILIILLSIAFLLYILLMYHYIAKLHSPYTKAYRTYMHLNNLKHNNMHKTIHYNIITFVYHIETNLLEVKPNTSHIFLGKINDAKSVYYLNISYVYIITVIYCCYRTLLYNYCFVFVNRICR